MCGAIVSVLHGIAIVPCKPDTRRSCASCARGIPFILNIIATGFADPSYSVLPNCSVRVCWLPDRFKTPFSNPAIKLPQWS